VVIAVGNYFMPILYSTSASNLCTLQMVQDALQGDHFPDHTKFPDFSSRGNQRLPSIECLPIWSKSLFHINEKQGEAR